MNIFSIIFFELKFLFLISFFNWFSSSLYGRIESSLSCLPRFYDHKKPHIAFADSGRRWTHHEAPKISVNWIVDCSVEVIESKTGKSIANNGRSRISKRSLFRRFVSIKNKLPYIDRDSDDSELVYADEKEKATDFQVCTFRMYQINHFYQCSNWFHYLLNLLLFSIYSFIY